MNEELQYPQIKDNSMADYTNGSYHVCLKVLDGPISQASASTTLLVGFP